MYGYNQMTKWGVICHRNKVALWLRCNKTKPPMLAVTAPYSANVIKDKEQSTQDIQQHIKNKYQ